MRLDPPMSRWAQIGTNPCDRPPCRMANQLSALTSSDIEAAYPSAGHGPHPLKKAVADYAGINAVDSSLTQPGGNKSHFARERTLMAGFDDRRRLCWPPALGDTPTRGTADDDATFARLALLTAGGGGPNSAQHARWKRTPDPGKQYDAVPIVPYHTGWPTAAFRQSDGAAASGWRLAGARTRAQLTVDRMRSQVVRHVVEQVQRCSGCISEHTTRRPVSSWRLARPGYAAAIAAIGLSGESARHTSRAWRSGDSIGPWLVPSGGRDPCVDSDGPGPVSRSSRRPSPAVTHRRGCNRSWTRSTA